MSKMHREMKIKMGFSRDCGNAFALWVEGVGSPGRQTNRKSLRLLEVIYASSLPTAGAGKEGGLSGRALGR